MNAVAEEKRKETVLGTCAVCKRTITRVGHGPISTKQEGPGRYTCAGCRGEIMRANNKKSPFTRILETILGEG